MASRDIPRVWEVDWAIPPDEGGTRWASYDWLLAMAVELGQTDVTILGATYENLGNLDLAIGRAEARSMRVQPHRYRAHPITVHGVSQVGAWGALRGPVLVAWARDEVLAELEERRPPAIAAVATWLDSIPVWRSVFRPQRIGQERPEQEAEFATIVVAELNPVALKTLDAAIRFVNKHHAGLDTDEREQVVGALLALYAANVPVDAGALRAHLMDDGWNGELAEEVITLAERPAEGRRPRHRPFPLQR